MVDRYYRKIESVENDIENSIQISSILLKLKGYDEKLGDLSKIENNENNISSNLRKIDTNKTDISSNLEKIDSSITAIKLINKNSQNNKTDISSNLEKIDTNKTNISSNLEKIDTNKTNISSNLEKINDNKEDILSLRNSNIKSFYNLHKIFIYDIKKGHQNIDKNNHYHIFEKEIIYRFIKDSYLEIILKVLTEISNYVLIGFFQILGKFYDENDNLFYTI